MARPKKIGLDYFPLDVHLEDQIELLEAEHGLAGYAILIKLWQKIYSEGYYIDWTDDNALLFARKNNTDVTLVNSVINTCLHRNLFNKIMYEQYSVLTSKGIQSRYDKVCIDAKRKHISYRNELLLIKTEFNTEEPELTQEESTQSKEEYIKEDNTKKDNAKECEVFFETVWKLYPRKKGKGQISLSKKKEIAKLGDAILTCIERYKKETKGTHENYLMYGSTFFNSGYIDYLDENYDQPKEVKTIIDNKDVIITYE